jgi:hypothetical protein
MGPGGLTISTSYARRSSTGARSSIPMPCSPGSTMSICCRFTALGAAGLEACPRAMHLGIRDHVIAMDSYVFEQAA